MENNPTAQGPNPRPAADGLAVGGKTSAGAEARADWLIAAVLLLATLLVFWPVTHADFLSYDDPDYVTNNPPVLAGLTWAGVAWAFRSLFIYWQPLTWLSYMLDIELFDLSARAFHGTNLLFHLANTGLVFVVLKRLTRERWPSAVVAALFALHPLHVESVAWISERKGLLSTFFFLLALLAYVRYAERGGWRRLLTVALCFALGLAAKAMLVTLPFVLLLLDFWPLRRAPRSWAAGGKGLQPVGNDESEAAARPVRQVSWPQLLGEKLALLPLALAASWLTVAAQHQAQAVWGLDRFPLVTRLAHAAWSYFTYLRKTLWPDDLALFYPRHAGLAWWQWAGAACVLGLVTLAVAAWVRRRPWLAVGWFWFLGTLIPVIGIVQAGDQSVADRYTYVPLLGLFLAGVWGASELFDKWRAPRLGRDALVVTMLLACGLLSARQAQRWQNTRTIFEHTLAVTRHNQVACAVVGSLRTAEGRFAEATNLFARALEYDPHYSDAHLHWAIALEREGQLDEAIRHYAEAVRLRGISVEARESFGLALAKQRRWDEAIAQYQEVLRLRPHSAGTRNNLGLAYHSQGQIEAAIREYTAALELDPRIPNTHNNLAAACLVQNRMAEAVAHYRAALALGYDTPALRLGLGTALAGLGQHQEAVQRYREVLRAAPDAPEALGRLAWLLATSRTDTLRDGAEALRLAQRACELTSDQHPLWLRSLAAAQAETGQYDEAVATLAKASAAAKAAGQDRLAASLAPLLKVWQEQRPYRQ